MDVASKQFIANKFGFLGDDFSVELQKHGVLTKIAAKSEIIKEGDKVKHVLFLIKGSIKVFSLNDEKELIYYYVRPNDSCLMTFSTIFHDYISKIYGITEDDTEVLLVPVSIMHEWLIRFPGLNRIFYHEYDKRFSDVMNMLNEAIFHKLDTRVLNYIKQRISITRNNPIKLTHKEIAGNLGTSREVVSRVLKKIENEGAIIQTRAGIGILENNHVKQF